MKNKKVVEIKELVEDAINLSGQWERDQVKWYKMRHRIKKKKSFPFAGCSNLRMPTIEAKVRKLKASLINIIFGIRPIVQVVPTPSGRWETAVKIEKFLDHMLCEVMKIKEKAIITVDRMLEKGFFLNKAYWKVDIVQRGESVNVKDLSLQEVMAFFNPDNSPDVMKNMIIEKYGIDLHPMVAGDNFGEVDRLYKELASGKKKVKATFGDVLCNYPDISLCEPERVFVSPDCGVSPQSARYVIHEFMMNFEDAKRNAEHRGWNVGDVFDIEAKAASIDKDKEIDTEKDLKEGIMTLKKDGKIKIWEYYGYDGETKKVITIAPDFDKLLREIELPYYSGKYPFIKYFFELTDDRWFAHRGIPEMIEDIVKEIDMQHNQKIDQQTIRNTPLFVHRAGMINPKAQQFIFGQSFPVQGMQQLDDLIKPVNNNNPNVEFSYEREQMLLETKIEELLGQVDFTLQSMINRRQPRTASEVQMQVQSAQQVFSLDAEMIRMSYEELFNWVWDLWCQYGDDEYEFAYFGENGWEKIKLTKEEIQGKYTLTVRGNDQNTNPQTRIQKAQMLLQTTTNQIALQSGIVSPANIFNVYKRLYQELDIPNWEELISQPQPQQQQQQQQSASAAQFRPRFKDLDDGEKAQVLSKLGIQPDMQAKFMKKMEEREKWDAEKTIKSAEALSKMGD